MSLLPGYKARIRIERTPVRALHGEDGGEGAPLSSVELIDGRTSGVGYALPWPSHSPE